MFSYLNPRGGLLCLTGAKASLEGTPGLLISTFSINSTMALSQAIKQCIRIWV